MTPGRWFVAAFPSPAAVATLEAIERPVEPGVRWVPPDRWHVTLRFLGGMEPSDVVVATAALDAAPLTVARARAAGRVGRLGRSALVIPVDGLDALAAVVAAATPGLGATVAPAGFRGHLTIARLRGRAACGLSGRMVEVAWDVDEVALVCSGGPVGPGYHVASRHRVAPGS